MAALSFEDQALVDRVVREDEEALVDAFIAHEAELEADADFIYGEASREFFKLFEDFFRGYLGG